MADSRPFGGIALGFSAAALVVSAVAFWLASLPHDAKSAGSCSPCLVDVAAEAGIDIKLYGGGPNKDHILESVGTGVAFIDYDRDNLPDIYFVNAWLLEEDPSRVRVRGRNALYRNLGNGRFEDQSAQAGVNDDGWGCGVCVGDYDGDGWEDLYVTNFGPNLLYRNRGDATFEEVASNVGVADPGWGAGCAFFDADHDGDADLYVANYIDCTMENVLAARRSILWQDTAHVMAGPFGMRGGKDHFFLNNGDGTFRDATDEAGMTDLAEAYGLGVLASDLDADGDVDLYVANDSNPNFLYRNDGTGHFTDIGSWCGAGYDAEGAAQAGMGVDAADLDGDGLQEIFVTNFAADHCTLYQNAGNDFFEDVSATQGIRPITQKVLSWGCAFLDVDRDMDQDLLIVNGHIYPQVDDYPAVGETYCQLPILLENKDGSWADVSRMAGPGLQRAVSARGLAVGDFDNDGDVDVVVTAMDSAPLLLRNDTTSSNHWVKVRLLTPAGAHALNATGTITVAGVTQMREVRSGSTYQSQNQLDLYFGLGTATTIDRLEIRWPNGTRTVRDHLSVDCELDFTMPAQSLGIRESPQG